MFGYPRLGRGTRPLVYSMCNAADEPCPLYDSRVGYANGTLHFGDRDGTAKKDERGSTLHFGDRDGTAKKDERGSTLLAVGRWFPPGAPVSSTRKLISSSFHRLDMTLAVAEALNP